MSAAYMYVVVNNQRAIEVHTEPPRPFWYPSLTTKYRCSHHMSDWRGDNRGAYRGRTRGGWRARGRGSGGQGNGPLSTRESTSVTHIPGPTSTLAHPGSTDARRRMNLMASVSRSSGLEKDGDK